MYVVTLAEPTTMPIYLSSQAQVALLMSKETEIPTEYSDFSNLSFSDSAAEILEQIGINDHSINLLDDKQPPYNLIYSLGQVKLEILKIYIKVNLASSFIRPSNSPSHGPILFIQKKDNSLWLCIDYQGLNNLTIKNRYLLPSIGESLNCLGHVNHFTQLDLTNIYYRVRIRKGDKWKIAFQIQYSYFEYQIMLFGLSNAPTSFQGYVNKILAEKLDAFVIIYLDDILIYIENAGQGYVKAVQ